MILDIVKNHGPITGEHIAERLSLSRATLRPDLAILTMSGFLDARPRVGYFYSGKDGNRLIKEEIERKCVKDYKAQPIIIKESNSVYDGICTLFLEDVGTLFVVNNSGHLAGVVSRKDLLRAALGNKNLEDIPISIIMTRMPNIVTCTLEESLLEAARKLIHNQIDSLPVVKPVSFNGKTAYEVVGRVTKTTITKGYVELGNEVTV
ncbi:MAG TPA: transcriptional regulator [Paenibacillaceae bacterium]|nr:transcriptional regulator [Paenibacillaceae bacterium]